MARSASRTVVTAAFSALALVGSIGALNIVENPASASTSAAVPAARAGSNLLGNPGAQAGAVSVQGWDTVTIPGWKVVRGLPTVVRYGTNGFPAARGHVQGNRGGQLFAGGVGGRAVLRQVARLRAPGGGQLAPGTRYALSARLGGDAWSHASVVMRFVSATGRSLGVRRIGPVGSARRPGLVRTIATGRLPAGTASAQVSLVFATSLKAADGEGGRGVGYNRAIADDLRLSVSAAAQPAARVRPPVAKVPRYKHVFLFYFENEDFSSIIGNTKQAPYLNSLVSKSSVLDSFYAEQHPSDGNYLALAGGSTFGVPRTDPLEINPLYTIHARNIGDLVTAAHENWKGYLQNANGPCDDTVHNQYWNDDIPMLYFADVRDRPAYCARHMLPLEALKSDLAHTATTPNLAWIGPDDCSDMEGCGIRAGDRFLASELGMVMRSAAWRTQRSLAVVTFDEDNYDDPAQAQRVATLVLGSSGVRMGYVSHVRYTHYSLLRTIEGALRLGRLTANDRYAQPLNDVFARGRAANRAPTSIAAAPVPARAPVPTVRSRSPRQGGTARLVVAASRGPMAFVANSASASVTPVSLRTRRAGKPIKVGGDPVAIVATPDGKRVYVASARAGTVTPIEVASLRAGRPIRVGRDPRALAITPDGRTVYVASSGSGTVTPISTRTGKAGRPITVGREPRSILIAPGGAQALVLDWGSAQVTPIRLADNKAERPIRVGSYPVAASFTPGGHSAYVASFGADTITPISLVTGHAGRPVRVGAAPDAIAVSGDGKRVYVTSGDTQAMDIVSTRTNQLVSSTRVGYSPAAIAISRSGSTGYVVSTIAGTLTPFAAATGRKAKPVSVGQFSYPTAMTTDPAGPLAAVIDTYSGQISLVNTRTGRVSAPIAVGAFPVAVAFAG